MVTLVGTTLDFLNGLLLYWKLATPLHLAINKNTKMKWVTFLEWPEVIQWNLADLMVTRVGTTLDFPY